MRIASILLCCAVIMSPLRTLHAQEDAAATQGVFTMKVYANLIQVPTLILDENKKPIPRLTRDKIAITIDDGPLFQPTRVHIEGDEPISLAILLDASGNQRQLVRAFGNAFTKLAPKYLHPTDRLTLYSLDCNLIRALNDAPIDAATLSTSFAAALQAPTLHGPPIHGRTDKPACANSLHLWDALEQMSVDLHQSPHRRVILLVSEGHDGKSLLSFSKASLTVGASGTALFAVRDRLEYEADRSLRASFSSHSMASDLSEDFLAALTRQNGGRVFTITSNELTDTLQDFVTMLRARYILEFPRPDDATSGRHSIAITVPGVQADIRAAGASFTLLDPAIRNDPLTIPSNASPAVLGTKRPTLPKN